METVDLDTLRGVDDFVAHRRTIEARIGELERECPGQAFSDDARDEYASLVSSRREVEYRIEELKYREAYVRTLAQEEEAPSE